MSAASKLLERLDGVRTTGNGRWMARCPAHADQSPSLSIREMDDGRVLLHDFGGCDTGDVLAAVGLTVADLFERPAAHSLSGTRSSIPARDLLEIISEETSVIVIVAGDMMERRSISEADWQRLATAAARIGRARDHAYGR